MKPRNRPSFRIILNHLEIAGNELLRQNEKEYFEAQQQWRKEVQAKMSTVGKNSHRMEQDLIKKRQEELRHAKDIRLAYERKLEKTHQMCLEVNAILQQLSEREEEVAKREKLVLQPGHLKNQRKFTTSIKKAQDRIYRKYMNENVQHAEAPSVKIVEEVQPAQLCTQLDSNNRPKSFVAPSSTIVGGVTTSTGNKLKKTRHRRVGSGTINSPKSSPSRERRYQSEPRVINSHLVDSETQTNFDDYYLHPELSGACAAVPNSADEVRLDEVDGVEAGGNNGRTMSTSENAPFHDACSTPDLLLLPDDQMVSSNDQLELRDSSDEDHLEILGRQVSELSERFSRDGGNASFKRAYVTETRNGEVTVLRCNRRANSEGEESWTDEEGESQSDSNYSLRRKR